ncbi:hypothetical protein JOF29_000115 [Kribbella aluminosa]|uniref:Integrase n=1 Tax=Kribbella aluminosa TaxID=416017 RepID=A0ABS4UBK9_9ACTN|nr:hypothetical protein [Kribbella aluminosa]MBP2349032.1 hypothetical protein [Kribbella aluminosa]
MLARNVSARSAVKRLSTADTHYTALKRFALALAEVRPAPAGPSEVTAAHVHAVVDSYRGHASQRDFLKRLRTTFRDDPELPPAARTALLAARVVPSPESGRPRMPYSDSEWRLIVVTAQRDIRVARTRIGAGRALLARYRSGDAVDADAELGRLLDVFDRTGELPRIASGDHVREVTRCGGVAAVVFSLCLSQREATSFAVLLTTLTGQNFGTVATWPAVHHRADGTHSELGVALLETSKPRRGPDREHMITALEDVPAGLAEVLDGDAEERWLFRSPLRVYRLLLELTELTRRHGGHTAAITAYTPRQGRWGSGWPQGSTSKDVVRWAHDHGFPTAKHDGRNGKPAINVVRIRMTAIERRRRPVAHTRQTMNDTYLRPSRTVQAESRTVVGAALRDQVDKARLRQNATVFTTEFVASAERDTAAAAREAGMHEQTLRDLLAGEHDTAVAACVDHHHGPHTEPGNPCPASLLNCLNCENARALPHQLPIQIAVRDRIDSLRAHLDPATWTHRYRDAIDGLEDILRHYTPAECQQARHSITPAHQHLVDNLIDGRLDLR